MPAARDTKTEMARKLGVSRSSLYYRPRPRPDDAIKAEVEAVMAEHPAYGHRRIAMALRRNRKAVRRVMRKFRLSPALRRRSRPAKPGDEGRDDARMPNFLDVARPIRADVVWAGDFTYFWFAGRFWCLATVIDAHTREAVGWHVGSHHTAALVSEALLDAVRRTGRTPEWFHSDQGSEYDAGSFAALLASLGIRQSMSRKGHPWENGFQESFYNNFKLELGDVERFMCVGEMVEAIHGQVAYHNARRIHTALGMPPAEFRKLEETKTAGLAAARLNHPTFLLGTSV